MVDSKGSAEVVDDFLPGDVVGAVAVGGERGDAGAVFVPFVAPEIVVVALVVLV